MVYSFVNAGQSMLLNSLYSDLYGPEDTDNSIASSNMTPTTGNHQILSELDSSNNPHASAASPDAITPSRYKGYPPMNRQPYPYNQYRNNHFQNPPRPLRDMPYNPKPIEIPNNDQIIALIESQ